MGQKVNPTSFRIALNKAWKSRWFSSTKFTSFLEDDIKIRDIISKKWARRGIADTILERDTNAIKITIHTSKPGLIIGRGGTGIEEMRTELGKHFKEKIEINVEEVKDSNLHAILVCENVAFGLEKKISFRRVIKQALERTKQAGAQGVKISVSGRLNGVEMARREWVSFGRIPLHTLRADIDYAACNSYTNYGVIGVKVWIYKGEVFNIKNKNV